jgi:GDP-D-mannose dehydratase
MPKIVWHYAERRSEARLGNLDLYRDFSDVNWAVGAYARLILQSNAPAVVNVCSGRAIHLADILIIMEEISWHWLRRVTDPRSFATMDRPTLSDRRRGSIA